MNNSTEINELKQQNEMLLKMFQDMMEENSKLQQENKTLQQENKSLKSELREHREDYEYDDDNAPEMSDEDYYLALERMTEIDNQSRAEGH